jgi:hypothetical protein
MNVLQNNVTGGKFNNRSCSDCPEKSLGKLTVQVKGWAFTGLKLGTRLVRSMELRAPLWRGSTPKVGRGEKPSAFS